MSTPRTNKIITDGLSADSIAGLDDLQHYMASSGRLAKHSRQLETEIFDLEHDLGKVQRENDDYSRLKEDRDGLAEGVFQANRLLSNYVDCGGGVPALLKWSEQANKWGAESVSKTILDQVRAESYRYKSALERIRDDDELTDLNVVAIAVAALAATDG